MNPFDYVNQILQGKENLIVDEETEKGYNPYLVNRSLSYHFDTIMYANETNRRHHVDKKMQHDFLINTVRSKKRSFAKWIKRETSEDLEAVKLYFNFSDSKAREALKILSDEDINIIKGKTDIGGMRK